MRGLSQLQAYTGLRDADANWEVKMEGTWGCGCVVGVCVCALGVCAKPKRVYETPRPLPLSTHPLHLTPLPHKMKKQRRRWAGCRRRRWRREYGGARRRGRCPRRGRMGGNRRGGDDGLIRGIDVRGLTKNVGVTLGVGGKEKMKCVDVVRVFQNGFWIFSCCFSFFLFFKIYGFIMFTCVSFRLAHLHAHSSRRIPRKARPSILSSPFPSNQRPGFPLSPFPSPFPRYV